MQAPAPRTSTGRLVRHTGWLLLPLLLLSISACGSSAAPGVPTSTPQPTIPAPTATVGLVVAVEAVPTATHVLHHVVPTPTLFKPPQHPYLILIPASGPPAARAVTVRGGNLPKSVRVDLIWEQHRHLSSLGTAAYTTRQGTLRTRFSIPAAPPGKYKLVAEVSGVKYATGRYDVKSRATLFASARASPRGEIVTVSGRRFLPSARLVLVAYAIDRKAKPVVLARVRSARSGRFRLTAVSRALDPGQYALRAWTTDALSAQVADTVFEVDV